MKQLWPQVISTLISQRLWVSLLSTTVDPCNVLLPIEILLLPIHSPTTILITCDPEFLKLDTNLLNHAAM